MVWSASAACLVSAINLAAADTESCAPLKLALVPRMMESLDGDI